LITAAPSTAVSPATASIGAALVHHPKVIRVQYRHVAELPERRAAAVLQHQEAGLHHFDHERELG
jgi:hypothetical protein